MRASRKQYELTKASREVVFTFCESISWEDYIRPVPNFGQGSIRGTQVHIANAYIHWIGRYAMQKNTSYLKHETFNSLPEVLGEYQKINHLMEGFFDQYDTDENISISNILGRHGEVTSTPLTLFTHMITHEFHHKGQIVSMARIMGYPPPDTDLIRL